MTDKELPPALSSLVEALLAYQDTQEGLSRVRSVAQSMWGDKWREQIVKIIPDCPADVQAKVKTNMDRALSYEKAGSMWMEASKIVDPRRPVDVENLKKQLPEFKKWLSVFGKAGQDLYAKVEKRANAPAQEGGASNDGKNPYGLTIDQLWNFDHFMRLKTYYDLTISRTSARCVHLGGLELTQYPYFGYILDLLDEILTFGMEILTPPYKAIVADRFQGGVDGLRKIIGEYKHDFETNAPPEMLSEEEGSLDEMKSRLGELADNSEPEGDIGPAPDGFDPDKDLPQQAQG